MAGGESAPVPPPVRPSVLRVLVLVFYSEASCWLRREGNICRQDGGQRGWPSGRHFGGDLLFVNEKRQEVDARRVQRGAVCPCCVANNTPPPPHPPGENDAFNAGVRDANRSVCRDLHLATNRIAGKLSPPNQ